MLNPDDIAFIFQNLPDPQTHMTRGYTIGRIAGRLPNGKPARIIKEVIPDDVGEALAKVMAEKAKREYGGALVAPNGDPLTETLQNVTLLDKSEKGADYKDYNPRDLSGVEENVKKKDRND